MDIQRLLPSAVDELAVVDPHRILYSVPRTRTISDGFLDITAKIFARAVNRCAWHIEANIGRAGPGFPTLTYMGPQDVVYAILILACVKTGYKLLLTSPRNTLEAHLSLFEKTECSTFLMPPNFPLPIVQHILTARKMAVLKIYGWEHWISEGIEDEVAEYIYDKEYSEAKLEPFVVLHTSGSTGLPKPIVQTHATVAPFEAFAELPSKGFQPTYPAMCAGDRVYLAFPLFHCAGLSMLLPGAIFNGFTIVLGPFPPSAEVANAIHVHGNVQQSCLAPMTLIDLAKDPSHLENLSRLKQITFGGGPCPKSVGDLVSSKTRFLNCLGTTECSVLPVQLCDPEDWAYLSVSRVLGHQYRHFSDDLYEMFIVRNPDLEAYQAVFGTFPDLKEFRMGDLYTKHPSKEGLWLYRGRTDDIIVFSNGEKINPLEMESIISAHPAVDAALVVGLGRVQSSLLVEAVNPPTGEDKKSELIDTIWPSVQAANQKCPSHGRIHRHMIRFTSPEKPMPRAGKGTVQRRLTVDLYAKEIDELYESSAKPKSAQMGAIPSTFHDVQDLVQQIVAHCTDIDIANVDPSADLFELGLDSLQILLITREINNALPSLGRPPLLEPRLVYANPSIGALSNVVDELDEHKNSRETGEGDGEKLQKILNNLSANMPVTARRPESISASNITVLLTGSTGSLGSYILDSLLKTSTVSKVFCLNRGPKSYGRQQESFAAKGLDLPLDKVQFLDASFEKSYFGLTRDEYKLLLETVTLVIHNAWHVDFNKSIDFFRGHLHTVRNFVDFSSHSRLGAKIFFVSSVSTVSNWRSITGQEDVPESVIDDWRIAEPTGYGHSKFLAERLLDIAAKEASVPVAICRVGQVAGPLTATGMWPKHEWFPSLLTSSKYISKLPADLGFLETVDWIPVDVLGQSLVEFATRFADEIAEAPVTSAVVFHAANPDRTSWATLLPNVAQCLGAEKQIQIVPLPQWVSALRESAKEMKVVAVNPAIKLLDFYERLEKDTKSRIVLDNSKACTMSPTLATMTAVNGELIENWMRQWAF